MLFLSHMTLLILHYCLAMGQKHPLGLGSLSHQSHPNEISRHRQIFGTFTAGVGACISDSRIVLIGVSSFIFPDAILNSYSLYKFAMKSGLLLRSLINLENIVKSDIVRLWVVVIQVSLLINGFLWWWNRNYSTFLLCMWRLIMRHFNVGEFTVTTTFIFLSVN